MDVAALGAQTTTQLATAGNSTLDKDAFLNLVVTQLRNQNPLEPTGAGEFMAQLAQLGTMEQTENLNKNLSTLLVDSGAESLARAAQLVGRRVEYLDSSTGQTLPGIVSAVELEDGEVYLEIGPGESVPLSSLVRIVNGTSTEEF
jgi:flagellar basal-body rod modification protein FlgD